MIGFGSYGIIRRMEIKDTFDERLIMIDPTQEVFFDKVLGYSGDDIEDACDKKRVEKFIEAIKEVKAIKLAPFWRPIFDPTIIDAGYNKKVVFEKGMNVVLGYSYNFWNSKAKEMRVERNSTLRWSLGTEYQYYAFLVWLINQLVESGILLKEAMLAITKGSYFYTNSINCGVLTTGRKKAPCGVYDLNITAKILRCSNTKLNGFWLAASYGSYDGLVDDVALAELNYFEYKYRYVPLKNAVGWFVLERKCR